MLLLWFLYDLLQFYFILFLLLQMKTCLHEQNFCCFNVYLAFSSNPSFRDFAARIAGEY